MRKKCRSNIDSASSVIRMGQNIGVNDEVVRSRARITCAAKSMSLGSCSLPHASLLRKSSRLPNVQRVEAKTKSIWNFALRNIRDEQQNPKEKRTSPFSNLALICLTIFGKYATPKKFGMLGFQVSKVHATVISKV